MLKVSCVYIQLAEPLKANPSTYMLFLNLILSNYSYLVYMRFQNPCEYSLQRKILMMEYVIIKFSTYSHRAFFFKYIFYENPVIELF